MTTKTRARSAVDGQFAKKSEAARKPREHVLEKIEPKQKSAPKKGK